MDQMVLETQKWLNATYKNNTGYNIVVEDGITGWSTMYALTRALQIELGIASPSNSFGTGTLSALQQLGNISMSSNTKTNIVKIIQSGLYCKGYNPSGLDGGFGLNTALAIEDMQKDLNGTQTGDGVVTPKLFKALLTMDAYVTVNYGSENVRAVQQWLNRKYINRKNFYYIPCDGHYSRDVQKALVYGIQYELGMDDATANGNFGPGTQAGIKANLLTVGAQDTSKSFVHLFQGAMIFNNNLVNFDGVFSQAVSNRVKEFQEFVLLSQTGNGDFQTWASLLVSTGDSTRKGKACDTVTEITAARATALINNGYETVGRYLTNVQGSSLNKKIQPGEIQNILNSGLTIFPIYQTYGGESSYFSENQGKLDAEAAVNAAVSYGFTEGTTIYFAVDFDAFDTDVTNNILPHFKGINNKMKELMSDYYKVGIYGPRNVCTRVSDEGYAETSFVSGMSTGFSGNLGYSLPLNWAFDQISTIPISSSTGSFNIDNNIKSNRYKGETSIDPKKALAARKFAELKNTIPFFKSIPLANLVFEQEIPLFDVGFVKGSFLASTSIKDAGSDSKLFEIKNGQIEATQLAELDNLLGNISVDQRLNFQDLTQKLALSIKEGSLETKTEIEGNQINVSLIINYKDLKISNEITQDLSFELKFSFRNLNDQNEEVIDQIKAVSLRIALVGFVIAILFLLAFESLSALAIVAFIAFLGMAAEMVKNTIG